MFLLQVIHGDSIIGIDHAMGQKWYNQNTSKALLPPTLVVDYYFRAIPVAMQCTTARNTDDCVLVCSFSFSLSSDE
jgi:hypothetical protein